MKKLFFVLFLSGFFCDNNDVVVDAEGVPHVDSEAASDPANKPSTLEDKSNVQTSDAENKDGIENDTLKSKNAEVLK